MKRRVAPPPSFSLWQLLYTPPPACRQCAPRRGPIVHHLSITHWISIKLTATYSHEHFQFPPWSCLCPIFVCYFCEHLCGLLVPYWRAYAECYYRTGKPMRTAECQQLPVVPYRRAYGEPMQSASTVPESLWNQEQRRISPGWSAQQTLRFTLSLNKKTTTIQTTFSQVINQYKLEHKLHLKPNNVT